MPADVAGVGAFGQGRREPGSLTGLHLDGSPATDFAITNMNVPDRLDMREVRDRSEQDGGYRRASRLSFDRYYVRLWFKRLLAVGALAALVYWLATVIAPLRDNVEPESLGARLSAASGQKVAVGATRWRLTPSPGLTLLDIDFGGAFKVGQVDLRVNWEDAWKAVRGGGWIWGEATVGALQLAPEQAIAVLRTLNALGRGLPAAISTIRLSSVELPGALLMPGKYEVVVRRADDGTFGPARVRLLGIDGALNLTVALKQVDGEEIVDFQLDGQKWKAPIGPRVTWSEAVVTGTARPNLIDVQTFSLSSAFGTVQGTGVAARDVEWVIAGNARAASLDVESLLRQLRADVKDGGAEAAVPFHGSATVNVLLGGRGNTLDEAVARTVFAGPLQVRWGTLNGINLGYAATKPGPAGGGTAGGITRFTELQGSVSGGSAGIALTDLFGRAGAMATRGEIRVAPDLSLAGALRVDLGATRVQAPINVRVRGTVLKPEFGR